jgi:HD-GYP domain-containing protein (c-di-GMP phosphodiesterase class II)
MGKALEDHLIALKTDRLRPGMFIAALDRLWLHTPFPPGGFYIRDEKQITKIGRFCTFVYIDPLKSEEPDNVIVPFEQIPVAALAPVEGQQNIADEIPWARQAFGALNETVRQLVHDVRAGRLPDLDALNTSLAPVSDSIQRCPDAMLWLVSTEPTRGYLYRRALGTSITAMVFGFRLGFDREALSELGLGGLLLDIGKIEVPIPLLAKPDNLSPLEHELIRKHVGHAMGIVRMMDDVPERVVEMIECHHERADGSGYPQQQRGTEIPLFARIAAIVDTYDAITQERRYAPAISGHTALRYLNGQRHAKFDEALLQDFIHAMGVYPTGTWVELLDGSVGVVCAQNALWPLTPQIAVMVDHSGNPLEPRTVSADRMNPIISARHPTEHGPKAPDLEAIA